MAALFRPCVDGLCNFLSQSGTKLWVRQLVTRRGRVKQTSMGSFIHHDRIAEKLEIARTMGLITNYLVAPAGPATRPEASVKVWRSPTATEAGVRHYLT